MKNKLTISSLFILLIVASQVSLAANATIVSWGNNVTNNEDLSIYVEQFSSVTFNVTANQTISDWHWSNATIINGDGTVVSNATMQFTEALTYYVTVYGNNTNGTTSLKTWTVTIAPTPTYSISGYVLNASDNKPISGAIVSNPTLSFNTTDANGYYKLSGAPNGTWRVTATATGYTGNYTDATVDGADLTNKNITLQPVTPSPSHPGELKIVWFSPGAVDYVFINETISETITYMVTTNQPTTNDSWYLDYVLVSTGGQSFSKSWSSSDIGRHVIKYTGKNANGTASFEWYVNVYNETAMPPEKRGLFEIIDEALANHVYDIKIRMFEYKVELSPNASEKARLVRERNQLMHDEIAKRQMTREALRKEFKEGNITKDTFVTAMHRIQSEMKNAVKEQKSLEKIEKKVGPAKNGKSGQSNGKGHDKWE